jgi:hypothetical protein
VPDRPDLYVAIAVLAGALVALFYPLIEGRQLGWPTWSIVVLAASVPLLGVFILTQARHCGRAAPLADLTMFRSRATTAGLGIALILFGSTSFFFVLTLHLQDGLGYSALRTGVSFVPFSIGIILGSAAAAPLGQRFGRAAIATGAAAITLTLASLLAVVAHYGTALHTWQLAPQPRTHRDRLRDHLRSARRHRARTSPRPPGRPGLRGGQHHHPARQRRRRHRDRRYLLRHPRQPPPPADVRPRHHELEEFTGVLQVRTAACGRLYLAGELEPRFRSEIENGTGTVLGVADEHAVTDGDLDAVGL